MNRWPVLLLGIILALAPLALGHSILVAFLVLAAIFSLAALGMDLILGYAGQISLGQGGFMAIGAYASALLTIRLGLDPLLALIIGVIVTAVVAAGIGFPLLGLLSHFNLAIASLAFGLLINVILIVGGDVTGGFTGIQNIPAFSVAGLTITGDLGFYYLAWGFVFVCLLISLNIGHSQAGRILKAIQNDEMAAAAMGVNVTAYKVAIFVVAAMFSSAAGSLLAHYSQSVVPSQFDIATSFDLTVMPILGGRASLIGAILGALFLKLLPQVTQSLQDYRLLSNGLLLLVVLLFFPDGLVGIFRALFGLVTGRRAKVGAPAAVALEPRPEITPRGDT